MEEIEKKLKQALLAFASAAPRAFDQTTTKKYMIDFSYERPSDFPVDRFEQTEEDGILYRPEIVAEMKTILLTGHERKGLFVRGPHGVGKSHSLVNLVHGLRAEDHIVTFIPTCQNFNSDADFLVALLRSIGSNMSAIGINRTLTSFETDRILDLIESTLPTINKNWVFVFDQVNRIFARPQYQTAKDVGALPLPFALMHLLNNRARMKTVISASANNTVAYRDNHPGFLVYDHPTTMSRDEVLLWKPDLQLLHDEQIHQLEEATGFCPLQVVKYRDDSSEFASEGVTDILSAVASLLAEQKDNEIATNSIRNAAVHCLLSLPITGSAVVNYDRKFSVLRKGHVEPLFPLVLVAYRQLFWNDVVKYVEENEGSILKVCGNENTTNDVRGRFFELLVIVRFIKSSVVSTSADTAALPASVDSGRWFESQNLPDPVSMQQNTLFIPKNSNFPAIDLILKAGNDVWAVQVHVSKHTDVLPKFRSMCEEKEWFATFDNINLLYLSPSDEVKNMLGACIPTPPVRRSKRLKVDGKPIYVSAATIEEFDCLQNIQWTAPAAVDGTEPMET